MSEEKTKRSGYLLAIALCGGLHVQARADVSLQGAEPSKLEHLGESGVDTGYVLDVQEFEIELVAGYADHDAAETQEVLLELEYGLTEGISLELELPYRWVEWQGPAGGTDEGLGALELEAKFLLYADEVVSLAWQTGVEFPTGDEEVGGDIWAWENSLSASWRMAAGLVLHSQIGFEFEESEGVEEGFGLTALDWQVEEEFRLQLALGVEAGEGETAVVIGPGATFELEGLQEDVEIGVGAFVGLTDDAPDWGVRAAVEFEF